MCFSRKLELPCKKANFKRRLGSSIACWNQVIHQPISLALWCTNCAKKKPHAPTTLSIRFEKNARTLDRLSDSPATEDGREKGRARLPPASSWVKGHRGKKKRSRCPLPFQRVQFGQRSTRTRWQQCPQQRRTRT